MEQLDINTGLDGFICLDQVLNLDSEGIRTSFTFPENNKFTIVESMAQTGALHLRYLTGLKRFVFLLKIKDLQLTDLKGRDFIIDGKVTGNSDKAYSYRLRAENGSELIGARMVFAAETFDDPSFENSYRKHYKKVLQCLMKNSEED